MRLGTRVWSLGKFLLLAGALGATFLLFFGISVRVALRAQEVDVPTLVGRTTADAAAALAAVGLGVRVDPNPQPDAKVPAGHVVRQDPPAGQPARRERTVRLWVSAGPRSTTVPDVIGQSERLARIRFAQDGLEVAAVSEIRSLDYQPDAVVAQDPPATAQAPRVSVLVNRTEPAVSFVMPDLTLQIAAAVTRSLQERGFRVTATLVSAPGVLPGVIIRQHPPAGFRVSQIDPISFEVSR